MKTATREKPAKVKPVAAPEPKRCTIPATFTVGQLLKMHALAKAEPETVFEVRGFAMPAYTGRTWLQWFRVKLAEKMNRNAPSTGKGNRAAKRIAAIRDAKAECKWCGQLTGSTGKRFCEPSCARAYNS